MHQFKEQVRFGIAATSFHEVIVVKEKSLCRCFLVLFGRAQMNEYLLFSWYAYRKACLISGWTAFVRHGIFEGITEILSQSNDSKPVLMTLTTYRVMFSVNIREISLYLIYDRLGVSSRIVCDSPEITVMDHP
jgi:hypothetical protein